MLTNEHKFPDASDERMFVSADWVVSAARPSGTASRCRLSELALWVTVADQSDFEMFVPRWGASDAGLLLPTFAGGGPAVRGLPGVTEQGHLAIASKSLILGDDAPRGFEQVSAFVAEEELGFTRLDEDDVRALVRRLPFDAAMCVLAALFGWVDDSGWGSGRQAELANSFYGGVVAERLSAILAQQPGRHAFAPQGLHVLMKLLIEEAADAPTREWNDDVRVVLARATLGVHSIIEHGIDSGVKDDVAALLAYLVQASGYYSRQQQLVEIARAMELHRLGIEDPGLLALPEHCPLEEWLVAEYGLSFDEQFMLGFGLAAMAHAWEPAKSHRVREEHFDDLLLKLGLTDRREQALSLVSADRAEFRDAFAAATGARALAWEVRPFKERPFLRLSNGDLLLLNGSWILSWLSEGFYYRGLRHAEALDRSLPTDRERKKRPHGQRYTQYFGKVFEHYGLRLAESCHELPSSTVVSARVHGEQPYSGQLTSDIAIDLAPDLVLVELNHGRFSARGLIEGDPQLIRGDLERVIVKKVNQVGNCITNLLGGAAAIPGVNMNHISRIWPVVVTNARLIQNPLLWDFIRGNGDPAKTRVLYDDARVRPLTLMDAEDFEQFCGLIEAGTPAPVILERKTQEPWRERDFAVWLHDDPEAPSHNVRASLVEDIYSRGMDNALKSIDFAAGIQPDNGSPAE